MADKNTKPADDTKAENQSSTGAPDAQAAEIAALKEQLAQSEKAKAEAESRASAAEEQAKASNDELAKAQTSGNSEMADLRSQIAALAAKVDAAPAVVPVSADDEADKAAAFAPRVVPGETDEFGRPWNPPKPFKQPRAYRATEPVYVDGVLYQTGETVVTNQRPSRTLVPITLEEKVAIEAGDDIHGDVNLADMSATELRAWLASKGVDHGGIRARDDLLAAALAWNDPTR